MGQAAVHALRTLLEDHDHIVQEISEQNDFGEDFYVTFVDGGRLTSDTIKVQVKGGTSRRRGNGYARRYRGRQAALTHLSEMSGVEFDSTDHVLHFVNGFARLGTVSRQSGVPAAPRDAAGRGDGDGSDPGSQWSEPDLPTAEDLELNRAEIMRVVSCFASSQEADEPTECEGCPSCTGEEPMEHGNIEVDVLHDYVIARIVDRIESEPDLLSRSSRPCARKPNSTRRSSASSVRSKPIQASCAK
ncbi:DUF4365 domain-containing protein [Streptomyces sp. HF10]|uniref:DUF4365 domain-containing protein n=1 Tax=Streptomyces sp. HF10 TaxID=2692233 RepID=UPI002E2C0767|nr:DUF4365 domain-containing protein [Streptomyces sp. HF10]